VPGWRRQPACYSPRGAGTPRERRAGRRRARCELAPCDGRLRHARSPGGPHSCGTVPTSIELRAPGLRADPRFSGYDLRNLCSTVPPGLILLIGRPTARTCLHTRGSLNPGCSCTAMRPPRMCTPAPRDDCPMWARVPPPLGGRAAFMRGKRRPANMCTSGGRRQKCGGGTSPCPTGCQAMVHPNTRGRPAPHSPPQPQPCGMQEDSKKCRLHGCRRLAVGCMVRGGGAPPQGGGRELFLINGRFLQEQLSARRPSPAPRGRRRRGMGPRPARPRPQQARAASAAEGNAARRRLRRARSRLPEALPPLAWPRRHRPRAGTLPWCKHPRRHSPATGTRPDLRGALSAKQPRAGERLLGGHEYSGRPRRCRATVAAGRVGDRQPGRGSARAVRGQCQH
jgi:hypothetical protein